MSEDRGHVPPKPPGAWRLVVVTDERLSRGRSHVEIARAAIAGGADAIQLRDKQAEGRRLFELAVEIRRLCRSQGVAFVVNDRVDVALAADADGVHVGQADLPAPEARRLLGRARILGVSAATPEEAARAERDGADYVGFGPVYEARGTKPDATAPLGLAALAEARRRCSLPLVAIGGIDTQRAAEVVRSGASGVAVISAVVAAADIAEAVRAFRRS
jgi:thiamine-phosphate pyrophosphorylase